MFFIFCSVTMSFGQEIWENKQLGFSIQKPKNWFVSENKKLIDILKTPNLTDRHINTIVEMHKGNLMVRFQKYSPQNETNITPSIQITVRPNPADDFQVLKKRIIADAEEIKRKVDDFKFIEEIREVEISGIKSIYYVVEIKKKAKDGTKLTTRAQMLRIPYKNYFFQVNFIDESDEQTDEDCTKIFEEVVKTIKIGESNKN